MTHTVGKCVFKDGGECEAQSTYVVEGIDDISDVTFEWNLISEEAWFIPFDEQRKNEITVVSKSDKNISFTVEVKITFPDGEVITLRGSFTHYRVKDTNKDVCVQDLYEIQTGQCYYDLGGVCDAFSKYRLVADYPYMDELMYIWSVQNGTIIGGQGTDVIEVQTTSNRHERIYVKCIVQARGSSASSAGWFTHTRYTKPQCAYFRVWTPYGHEAWGPVDVWYFRTSELIHGTCPPPDKGSNENPERPEEEDPDAIRCYNFNCAVSHGAKTYENYRQSEGNFSTSAIHGGCTD